MKKLFYGKFTNVIIKNVIIALLFLIGIRKGAKFILFQPGHTNKADGGISCWSEIMGFSIVWNTPTQLCFDITVHNYIHDAQFEKEVGLRDTFIQQEAYSIGFYSISEVANMLLAQRHLKKWFTGLYKPTK